MTTRLDDYVSDRRKRVDRELERLLPHSDTPPGTIHAAMRHSVFAGGKRIRPILAIAAAEACGSPFGIEAPACALECVHTYSLIHDDLPALDNDDLRRGEPACHKAFGESTAILAGDALQTLAFQILATQDLPAETTAAMVAELATAGGTVDGMIGGQVADIEAEGYDPTDGQVEYIHRAKTAALIRASVRFGSLYAEAGTPNSMRHEALSQYGAKIGLAFQIVDDVLDVVSSSDALGKTAGKDASQSKATYPALYGIEGSRQRARECLGEALRALDGFDERAWGLRAIADLIVSRTS